MIFPSDNLIYKSTGNQKEEWKSAKAILRANPSLMTSRILLLTLHNKPPLKVVQFMLSLNPQAATIPKIGPTALQVAVRHYASIDVIVCLLKACPFALLASNLGDNDFHDPLECAKQLRANEAELISILSQPLSYWLQESYKDRLNNERNKKQPQQRQPAMNGTIISTEKEELNNVKAIATTTIRAQKRQHEALQILQHKVRSTEISKAAMLREVDQHQQDYFNKQLIALDMKEKALRHKSRNMERRIMVSLEDAKKTRSLQEARQDTVLKKLETSLRDIDLAMKEWKGRSEDRTPFSDASFGQDDTVKSKGKMKHRSDMRLRVDDMEQSTRDTHSFEPPPYVYATPFPEEEKFHASEAEAPLFRKPPAEAKQGVWARMKHRRFQRLVSN